MSMLLPPQLRRARDHCSRTRRLAAFRDEPPHTPRLVNTKHLAVAKGPRAHNTDPETRKMSADWLDNLSEDWVSQPRTSSPSSLANAAPSQSQRSTRSRIPQLRSSSGAYSSVKGRASTLSKRPDARQKGILTESSTSRANIQSPPSLHAPGKPDCGRRGLTQRSISESSQGSILHNDVGTTRRATSASPPKDRQYYETPEWKRRLLLGKTDYGEKVDLFSPIGLEKMFKKPSAGTIGAKKKPRRVPGLKGLPEMPSSPPPWPGTSQAELSEAFTEGSRLSAVGESDVEGSADRDATDFNQARPAASTDYSQEEGASRTLRTASGTSNARSDSFSPVFISKHNGAHGTIEYAALDLSKTQLEQELAKLSIQSQARPVPEPHSPAPEHSAFSESFPDDLETGTPDEVPLGDFVSVKRGGYSVEGSFLQRPLSPSPTRRGKSRLQVASLAEDSMLPDDEASFDQTERSIRPPAPTPPAHATPTRPHQEDYLSPSRHQPSSPLKLFGAHDTFTTNRLQRRMSQLELNEAQENNRPETKLSVQREASEEPSQIVHPSRHVSATNRFGDGQFDGYAFTSEMSLQSPVSSEQEGVIRSRSPSPTMHPPGSKEPLKFRTESLSSEAQDTFRGKRRHSKMSTRSSLSLPKRSANNTQRSQDIPTLVVQTDLDDDRENEIAQVAEGKRPRTSPLKDPTPKRRRTLVFAELEDQASDPANDFVRQSHERVQSVIGRKRKDARQSNFSNSADPDVLAKRHILRPRNPTPSQRRREQVEQEVLDATEAYFNSSPRLQAIREHLQVPQEASSSPGAVEKDQARALAEEVAAFSVRISKGMKDEGRKRSVTTQDFLDEAMKIMDFFRKGKRPSGLGSLEESEESTLQDGNAMLDDGGVGDLTLSRPPSREGRESRWRDRDVAGLDPTVESRLKQFEDKEDEEFVASSFQSFHMDQASHHSPEGSSPRHAHIESDPPDIVVYENPRVRHRRDSDQHQEGDGPASKSSSMPSHKSHPSVDSSIGRTTVTTASGKSGVGTLHPAAVTHLIAEDENGMHFDKDKGMWVRTKSPRKDDQDKDISHVTGSDEDPFGGIPDLTVDEAEEFERVMSPSRRPTEVGDLRKYSEEKRVPSVRPQIRVVPPSAKREDGHQESAGNRSTIVRPKDGDRSERPERTKDERDAVEHEIKIHEGRSTEQAKPKTRKVSELRISFSSPLVTKQLSPRPSTGYKSVSKASQFDERRQTATRRERHDRGQLIAQQALEPVKERQEVSVLDFGDDQRRVNFSVSLSAPLAVVPQAADELSQVAPSSPSLHTTFLLSELSDFTFTHENENESGSRTIVKRGPSGLAPVAEDRFENGNTELVKALQDVEPEEPFWEDLRQVDLRSKSITSLHLLDMLCDRAEVVEVSDNAIAQLGGAPTSIRCLSVRNNLLTTLTSWNHLTNLQYLDVSGNDIDSLSGFACLMHLRELRADGNCITNLDGILGLDGLLSLSLRDNRLERVNLLRSSLRRLERLDLAGNKLSEDDEQNHYFLPSLTHLCLDNNGLESLSCGSSSVVSGRLDTLSLCNNRLDTVNLDSAEFPALRNVYLDNNLLTDLSGLGALRNVDVLSVCNQSPSPVALASSKSITSTLPDARCILLSGTHIPRFTFAAQGLHHVTHLDLASCGLTALPEDFAAKVPNVRYLNLGFNNLRDVTPLLGLKRLHTLLLAHNRVARLRKLAMVLERLRVSLAEVDLRDNPVTVGFYDRATAAAGSGCESSGGSGHRGSDDDGRDRLAAPPTVAPGSRGPGRTAALPRPSGCRGRRDVLRPAG